MARRTQCPVCGRVVDPLNAAATATDDARIYYFCSADCRDTLTDDPGRYLSDIGS